MIWISKTPKEKQSSLSVHMGGILSDSGGMYTIVPGQRVELEGVA